MALIFFCFKIVKAVCALARGVWSLISSGPSPASERIFSSATPNLEEKSVIFPSSKNWITLSAKALVDSASW